MRDFRFLQPNGIGHVLKVKAEEGADGRILAGGTNLLSYIKTGRIRTGLLIDITRLDELKTVREHNGVVVLGAGLTISELMAHPIVRDRLPCFAEALTLFGNPLIRNRATLGGNIADASPIADTAPILMVLDASVNLVSARGERSVPLYDFFQGVGETVSAPDEILASVAVPVPDCSRVKMVKLGLRRGTACSVTSVAVRLMMDDGSLEECRVALGGVAPTPVRAGTVERALGGKRFTIDAIEEYAPLVIKDINPISDVRGTADYRKEVSVNLLRRALKAAAGMEA